MMAQMLALTRRRLLRGLTATSAAALFRPQLASSQQARGLKKPIPSTDEELPAVGLGSWITFNVGNDPIARDACAQVMGSFFDSGGRLIDSSPMYGSSQKVIGYGLAKLNGPPSLFSADKVWIHSGARGPRHRPRSGRRARKGVAGSGTAARGHLDGKEDRVAVQSGQSQIKTVSLHSNPSWNQPCAAYDCF